MSIDLTRFHDSFFTESLEGLEATEAHLLALERQVGDGASLEEAGGERLNAIFRGVHSIKGAAGSLGFDAITEFTHSFEEFLDLWRKGSAPIERRAIDTVLACVDHARALVKAARERAAPDRQRSAELIATLVQLARDAAEAPRASEPEAVRTTYRIRFEPSAEFFRRGNDPLRLLRTLDAMGELTVLPRLEKLAAAGPFDPEACHLAWDLTLCGTASAEAVDEIFSWVRDDGVVEIENDRAPSKPSAPNRRGGDRRQVERRRTPRRTEDNEVAPELRTDRLHVSRDKVDELINLVGELVITKTMVKQVVQGLDPQLLARLEAGLLQLERNTRDLQEAVMGIRMLPMSHAFGRFERLVRDIAQNRGKQVRLELSGGESELDKSMIEKLVDPLTHLVRNALDHGIEPPAERRDRGKPEEATLRLHAEHRGGNIEIRVSDDGRGVDPERVEARAREAGLIGANEAITLERACELIFEPGLSTAEAVDELSGRGVGLDVVRKNILALAGSLSVESTLGKGTTFVLRLPLTLAIIDGMLVTVGKEAYIIPMAFIVECLQPDPARLKSIAGRGMLVEARGKYLPLLELGRITGRRDGADFARGLLLVVEAEGNQVALLVDALVGQEQVVIKSIESNYRKVPYIAGATILGEGRVVLILDVGSLVRAARE